MNTTSTKQPTPQQKQKQQAPPIQNKKEEEYVQETPQKQSVPKVVRHPLMLSSSHPLKPAKPQAKVVKSSMKPTAHTDDGKSEDKPKTSEKGKAELAKIPLQETIFKIESKDVKNSQPEQALPDQPTKSLIPQIQESEKGGRGQVLGGKTPQGGREADELGREPKVASNEANEANDRVCIKITGSASQKVGLSTVVIYQLQGSDQHGNFVIQRKYTQFLALRNLLTDRWPGSFIPSLNLKSEIRSSREKEKETRLILQNFLLGLSYSAHIYYKEEVQLFLRSPELNIEEMISQMPVLKVKDIIDRYSGCFQENLFESKAETTPQAKKIALSLHKIIKLLREASSKVLTLSQSYDHYSQSLAKFSQFSRCYEEWQLTEYCNHNWEKCVVLRDPTNSIDNLRQMGKVNPFYPLFNCLSREIRDAEALLESIFTCQQFIQKCKELTMQVRDMEEEIRQIAKGNSTFKTVASRKTKEEVLSEVEARQKKLRKDEYTMNKMLVVASTVFTSSTINIYKTFKRDCYQSSLQEYATLAVQTHPQIEVLWELVLAKTKELLRLD